MVVVWGGGEGGGGGQGGIKKTIQVATVLQNVLIHKTGLYPGGKAYIQNNIFVSEWMGINPGGGASTWDFTVILHPS